MRYLISVIVGILISITVFLSIAYVIVTFQISPYSDFLRINIEIVKGNTTAHNWHIFLTLARKVLVVSIIIFFPIVGFVTGVGVALVARKKTIILALVSVLPFAFLFSYVSSVSDVPIYEVAIIASSLIFAFLGTIPVKYLKSRQANKFANKQG